MAVNKVILLGNLGSDVEVRNAGQSTVASFRLATTEKFKGQDGQLREETEWHTCELWNNNNIYQYLRKGAHVYVEGSIRTENWTDQQGQSRSRIKIRVYSIQLVGPKPQQSSPQYQQQPTQQGYAPQQQGYQQGYQPQYKQQYAQAPAPQYQQPAQPQYQQAPPAPQGYNPAPQYQQATPPAAPAPQPPAPAPYAMPGAAPGSDLP